MNKKPSVVFMGTPGFAVESLQKIHQAGYPVKAVVTAPDKPAGRGRQIRYSDVKKYAESQNMRLLQPINLKDMEFVDTLKDLNADIFVVVAFRMLPKSVWEIPNMGCFNLHASLLPDYRGAAPINHAIINGESVSGVTSFYINEQIDTGDIIMQKKVDIPPEYTAGDLHDKLMKIGAELVLQTLEIIKTGNASPYSQSAVAGCDLKLAPKLTKEFCRINWNYRAEKIYNFIRGLSPYPGAYTNYKNSSQGKQEKILKVFYARYEICNHNYENGRIISDNKNYLKVACADGTINILELQAEGKKRMKIKDFLRGNNTDEMSFL
jgi:methionyl-tRNA formyltransferase